VLAVVIVANILAVGRNAILIDVVLPENVGCMFKFLVPSNCLSPYMWQCALEYDAAIQQIPEMGLIGINFESRNRV